MPDYTKNHQNALGGHTSADAPLTVKNSRTNIDDIADVRDLMSALVGAGAGGLKPDDQAAVYARLGSILGKPTANKLINQALIFNQRPDVLAKNAQQRITQFYDMGSRDPELDTLIQKTKTIGEGPISGANQSVNDLTRKVQAGANVKDNAFADPVMLQQIQAKSGGL